MTIKQERVRDLLHSHLSSALLLDVTDPALRNVTITRVEIDRELEYADIYVNALGDEKRQEEVLEGLKRANGFLRKKVASRLRLRHMPVLHFHWDRNLAAAEHIEQLLDAIQSPSSDASPSEPEGSDE